MNYFYIIIIVLLNIKFLNATLTLKGMAFIMNAYEKVYREMIDEFNRYSKDNNLDIFLEFNFLTENNSTYDVTDYGNVINSLLTKKSTKYDMYIYFDAFNDLFAPHFINLKEYLDDDFINTFPPEFIKRSYINNSLTGIPCFLCTNVLYSNRELLTKYGKEPPKTWDELIETSKYILNEEKKQNNTDLIAYNGVFAKDSEGTLSVFEFIHSFRESKYSPYPSIRDQETKDSIKMIKKIKDEISSDKIFSSDIQLTFEKLNTGGALFLKCYYLGIIPQYITTALPGKKEGISGSILSPGYISVSRYVDKDHQKAATEFIKFYTSRDTQKKYFMKTNIFSSVSSLYDDEETCQWIDCDVVKQASPYIFVAYDPGEYTQEYYYAKFRQYAYEYIFENESISKIIKKMDDLKKVYYFTFKNCDSSVGLILSNVVFITLLIMCLLLIFFVINRKYLYNKFLPNEFWIISMLGSIFILGTIFTLYEKLSVTKCFLNITIFTTSFYINIIPIFNQLIVNFPKTNKISDWFKKRSNRYLFLLIIIFINIGLIGLIFIKPYTIKNVLITDGENFQICNLNSTWSQTISRIIYYLQIFILLILLSLIFIEWNLTAIFFDIRIITPLIFTDLLILIIYRIFNYINIKNYIFNGINVFFVVFFISLSNYIFTCLLKVYYLIFNSKKNSIENMIEKLKVNEMQFTPEASTNISTNERIELNLDNNNSSSCTYNSNRNSHSNIIMKKVNYNSPFGLLMKYHYQNTISN
ncbi:periplasmic binding protein-like II [Anaeromyces robustus]|uniref:Periplasmic binding protein-like II n=1 Tax=Anaeromyces robustus TaxID=1754192 RepID=A0A1Y1XLA5_9FUNG|nr:periplasmic binding protein-like II [Anaeromyces robustus]|eukprot:ORX86473.1 periplasmic binding protein-like II [Anaeromyces robustus]